LTSSQKKNKIKIKDLSNIAAIIQINPKKKKIDRQKKKKKRELVSLVFFHQAQISKREEE
jgi:hypothetical protein